MKSLSLLIAAAALALAGCNHDKGQTDAAIPPALTAPAPEPVAALSAAPPPAPVKAEPAPEPTPQEIAAFNAKVPK
jgi:hypothetical protein